METFIASRLSGGNKIYPIKITIDGRGVTLKDPGLFRGKEKTIPFNSVSSVNVNCPLVGYSTIIIETTGEGNIEAHGFTKSDVKKMKTLILEKI